jgi:hypothetical protein
MLRLLPQLSATSGPHRVRQDIDIHRLQAFAVCLQWAKSELRRRGKLARPAKIRPSARPSTKAIEAAVENVPMVKPPEENDDDEPQYTAWLDLPRSTREPMTAKDANAARKALAALDDRTPQQRLLGEPPTWRSALAQRNR